MLVTRSLQHYWKWHLGLSLGVAVAAMCIIGSLLVGASVRSTLQQQAYERLGSVQQMVAAGDGFFSQDLAESLAADAAPVLLLPGTLSLPDADKRANNLQILGITPAFSRMARQGQWKLDGIGLGADLAAQLGANVGDSILLRVEKPSLLSRDAPLSGESEQTAVISGTVAQIISNQQLGAFQLAAEQTPALNVFMPLQQLQEAVEQPAKVNLVLSAIPQMPAAKDADGKYPAATQIPIMPRWETVEWKLPQLGFQLTTDASGDYWRLATDRVFLQDAVKTAAQAAQLEYRPILTYLANELRLTENAYTAYPMIAAVDSRLGLLPENMPPDGMVVSQWTAQSLGLKLGDKVSLEYFTVTRARQLESATAAFTIAGILPDSHALLQPDLAPHFPGLSDAENCRDWKPGIPIKREGFIRPEDEKFWKERKTTPKAFISLSKGQELWRNRFGETTTLLFPKKSHTDAGQLEESLTKNLHPSKLGFVLAEPEKLAQQAVAQSMDFSGLFISMSFFLILTALVLVALLFFFNTESRAAQVGLLRATGYTAKAVRWGFLRECLAATLLGILLGAGLAYLYNQWILSKLSGERSGAVNGLKFLPVWHWPSVVNGALATGIAAVAVLYWASAKLSAVAPARLLAGAPLLAEKTRATRALPSRWRSRAALFLFGIACYGAVRLSAAPQHLQPPLFFALAFLLLSAGLLVLAHLLHRQDALMAAPASSPAALGWRNAVRRRGRSLAVAGLPAAGIFMVCAMNTMQADARRTRDPGTGDFTLIGQSDLPIYEDLNAPLGREAYGLEKSDAKFLPMRHRPGEEASCLNLNRAQIPSILGLEPKAAASLGSLPFEDVSHEHGADIHNPWAALDLNLGDEAIPAAIDVNSAKWALQKKLGDVIEVPDATGKTVKLRLVAFLRNTILQGHLLVSEQNFVKLYPDTPGYRFFLIQSLKTAAEPLSRELTRQFQNRGMALEPATERLARLQAVKNAYLRIFSVLGGLGLILSTVALGLLVARNVLERRGELALLSAAGYPHSAVRQVILGEYLPLFGAAVLIALLATGCAIWPHLRQGTSALPWQLILGTLAALVTLGIFFCILAAHLALRKPLVPSLRHE